MVTPKFGTIIISQLKKSVFTLPDPVWIFLNPAMREMLKTKVNKFYSLQTETNTTVIEPQVTQVTPG